MSRPSFVLPVVLVLSLFSVACRQSDRGMIAVGTHHLYYERHGSGSPAVVLDVGLGDSFTGWQTVIDSLAEHTQVFVYDRAGYGRSEAKNGSRDARTASGELYRLLKRARISPPWILLGHSLGAANLQVFAADHPAEVAGLVLIDPPPGGWITGDSFPELLEPFARVTSGFRVSAIEAEQRGDPENRRRAAFFRTLASEQDDLLGSTAQQINAISSFGDLPLRVIGSTVPNPGFGASAEEFQSYWIEENQRLAGLSSRGTFIIAEGSTHAVQTDAPDLVVRVVRELLHP